MTIPFFAAWPKMFYACVKGRHRWIVFSQDAKGGFPPRVACPFCLSVGEVVGPEAPAILAGEAESQQVSSGNPLVVGREPATEHIRNGQQMALELVRLLKSKDLQALALDVEKVNDRLRLALQEIEEGNIGK